MNANLPKPHTVSIPTMCLGCHQIVELVAGDIAWHCPHCAYRYDFKFWKIRLARKQPKTSENGKGNPV